MRTPDLQQVSQIWNSTPAPPPGIGMQQQPFSQPPQPQQQQQPPQQPQQQLGGMGGKNRVVLKPGATLGATYGR